MNCIAIDDEPLALNIIKDFCSKVDFLNLVTVSSNPIEAVTHIKKEKIDLIFLDIQMPNITGIEFLKTLNNPPLIIFTTAYSKYALEGFELDAIDYLVKPIPFERFLKAVTKAYELHSLRNTTQVQTNTAQENSYLMIKVEHSTVKLNLSDIKFIEGLKDYIKIHTFGTPILTKSTIKNIEEKLPANNFCRVHKSYLVAIDKIEKIENNRIIIDKYRIPIGDSYKSDFQKIIDNYRL